MTLKSLKFIFSLNGETSGAFIIYTLNGKLIGACPKGLKSVTSNVKLWKPAMDSLSVAIVKVYN